MFTARAINAQDGWTVRDGYLTDLAIHNHDDLNESISLKWTTESNKSNQSPIVADLNPELNCTWKDYFKYFNSSMQNKSFYLADVKKIPQIVVELVRDDRKNPGIVHLLESFYRCDRKNSSI